VLLFAALVIAKNDVTAADGARCASAYRSAQGRISTGGEIPHEERVRHAEACRVAARPVMRVAYGVAVAGGLLGVAALGRYVAARRPSAS
jgi:hypothetical protein